MRWRDILIAAAVLLLVWEAAALALHRDILPGPTEVITTFIAQFPVALGRHFFISTMRVVAALLLSVVVAVPLGLMLGQSKLANRLLAPLIYVLYPIPKIVFLPIIFLFLGIGELSKIFIIFLILFFQVLVVVRDSASTLRPELIAAIEKRYGFDKPPLQRFLLMLGSYLRFDLGTSFFTGRSVLSMIRQRLPVSMSLGLWSTLIIYLISIPLGIRKAVRDGSRFDVTTSTIIATLYAIPGFLFAILLIILFAGGSFLKIFPLRGLHASDAASLGWGMWIADYLWHLALPVATLVIGGFAGLTLLTKNSFLDEINKQYVITARAKGLTERRILYGHVFRNAMLIVISGFPAAILGIFFTEALLIENIFSIEGLGLMSFQAVVNRDYPVFFGTLYLFTLLGLLVNLLSDLTYVWVDPRIDFERRGG